MPMSFPMYLPPARRGIRPTAASAAATIAAGVLGGCGGGAQNPLPGAPVSVAAVVPAAALPLRIRIQPHSLLVSEGTPAVFGVLLEGDGPLAFQWLRDGVDIAGATQPALRIAAALRADDGARYLMVVRSRDATRFSSTAHLAVDATNSDRAFD
jgi:hypothetical protein